MAQQVYYNARNGDYLPREDPDYLPPGREGNECRTLCDRAPHYACTRDHDHEGDCAAHGWLKYYRNGKGGRTLVMFARWKQEANTNAQR